MRQIFVYVLCAFCVMFCVSFVYACCVMFCVVLLFREPTAYLVTELSVHVILLGAVRLSVNGLEPVVMVVVM